MINGSFGIGKTTCARLLRPKLPGAVIFDPEWIGFVLRRLPGYHRSDYQHLPSWRRLTILGARLFSIMAPHVIIPMTFTHKTYFREVKEGLKASGKPLLHVCLTAPLPVVQQRLTQRGEVMGDPRFEWVHRRAIDCFHAHQDPEFALHIPTEGRAPDEIAAQLARIASPQL